MNQPYSVQSPSGDPSAALRAVAEAADLWGAQWQPEDSGGRLVLPVSAGLRRGWVSGVLSVEEEGDGVRLQFAEDESEYQVLWPAVSFLVLASLGGLFSMVWPFFAHSQLELLSVAPMAALLALGGWFLVISRLQNSGPEDFLAQVVDEFSPQESPS